MNHRVLLLLVALVGGGCLSQSRAQSAGRPGNLRFTPGASNEFSFDTGMLRGKLRADGRSTGLSSVVHIASGTRLDRSMGLCGHYRVFSANHRYGTAAWDWASQATLTPDGAVEVRWTQAADRPFELRALYRWAARDALEVDTIVQAKIDLPQFESFLASYFAEGFTNASAYVRQSPGTEGKPGFMRAEPSSGTWLAFPRDDQAVSIIEDGRWKFEPNPVDWVIMPRLAGPLGLRRCPGNGVTCVLMSSPRDCFALMTPFEAEPHYSMYLSLFGRDLKAGEVAKARVRLVIGQKLFPEGVIQLFQRYLQTAKQGP
jgi:hypothetical protein